MFIAIMAASVAYMSPQWIDNRAEFFLVSAACSRYLPPEVRGQLDMTQYDVPKEVRELWQFARTEGEKLEKHVDMDKCSRLWIDARSKIEGEKK